MNAIDEMLLTPEPSLPEEPAKAKPRSANNSAAYAAADTLEILRKWAGIFSLTATSCAICGKDLTDSVSVTQGIGPDCSQAHYSIPVEITDEMVEAAMGRLATSHLDSRVKVAVRDLKTKPRALCNVLVWWSAVNLNKTDVVLECADVVSLLGFTALGNRLRERNTNVVLAPAPNGDFIIRCKAKSHVMLNMRRVREAQPVKREGRFKYGWRVPETRKDLIWTILGEGFGNQWATVLADKPDAPSTIVKIVAKSAWEVWRAIETTYNPPKPKPPVVAAEPADPKTIVRVTPRGLEVYTPERNWAFIAELKLLPSMDRRWNPDYDNPAASCWRVAAKHESRVRALVAIHFNGAY